MFIILLKIKFILLIKIFFFKVKIFKHFYKMNYENFILVVL